MVRSGRASIPPFTPGTIAPVACATPALPWLPVVQQRLESKFCRSPSHWSCLCQSVDVPSIALTMLAVHGCPMAGYTLCSSVLTEVACDKVVFQEICHREVTLLWQSPHLWQSCVSRGNCCPLRLAPRCGRVISWYRCPLWQSHIPLWEPLWLRRHPRKLPTPVGYQIARLCNVAVWGMFLSLSNLA